MIGNGIFMIQLKEPIGLEIKMLSILCVKKLKMQFICWKVMECHFQELKMEKFISELLEVDQKIMEKEDKLIDVQLLLIDQATPCSTLFLEELLLEIAHSLLNILLLILSWKMESVRELCA